MVRRLLDPMDVGDGESFGALDDLVEEGSPAFYSLDDPFVIAQK
jgi:hypothetical protein